MKKIKFWSMIMLMSVALPTMVACGSDDEEEKEQEPEEDMIDTTPISIFSDGTKSIAGADSIVSSNRFVVYTKGNEIHGYHVGETEVLVNNKKTIQVTVLPKYSLYDDPICKWGCDMNYVKNNQKQGTLSSKSTTEMLVYENAGAASMLMYTFKNNKLSSVGAVVSTNHTSTYASYLAERYLMVPYYEGKDTYFVGIDALEVESANTAVIMQVYNIDYLITLYTPASKLSTRSPQIFDWAEEAKTIIENLSL